MPEVRNAERDCRIAIDRVVNGLTLKAIGQKHGISSERVRHVVSRKLRDALGKPDRRPATVNDYVYRRVMLGEPFVAMPKPLTRRQREIEARKRWGSADNG